MNIQRSDNSNSSPLSAEPDTPVDLVQEELVAYLDGELDPNGVERVERRLTEDKEYHQRLIALQRSWDLLDHLPRGEATAEFTQSTVELVVQTIAGDVDRQGRKRNRWRMIGAVGIVVGVLAASVTGYAVVQHRLSEANRQLIGDLPVIENVDLYRNADSVTFLERLQEEGLFDDEIPE